MFPKETHKKPRCITKIISGNCCCNPVSFLLNGDPEIYFLLVGFIHNYINFCNYPREEDRRNYCAGFITGAILMPLCIGRVPCLCENDKKKKMVRKFSSKYFPQEEKFGKNLILEKLGFIIFEPHKKKRNYSSWPRVSPLSDVLNTSRHCISHRRLNLQKKGRAMLSILYNDYFNMF